METIKHDTDGNLTHDAGKNIRGIPFEFVWDAENRLVKVLRDWDDALIARYYYDYLGRRVRSVTTALGPQGVKDTGYVYDGWNLLTEYDLTLGTSAPVGVAYLWGTDLSGGLQGAGGVGGLLEVSIGGTAHHYPIYDGSGNVTKYIASNGTTSASYRYDPFGQLVGTTGTWESFRHRFSTKPQDQETGLLYYGFRYYESVTGRWPSRDPIGERGGTNLYEFVYNNAFNWIDYLGGQPMCISCLTGEEIPLGTPLSGHGTNESGGSYSASSSSLLESVTKILPGEEGCFTSINATLLWIPYPGGKWDVTFSVSGCIECCKNKDGSEGLQFVGEATIATSVSVGYGAGGNRGLIRDSRIKNTKLRGDRGRIASNPEKGRNPPSAGGSLSSDVPECQTQFDGAISFEIGGRAGAGFVVNPYANVEFAVSDPISFDYGARAGFAAYVGAEIYLEAAGTGSGTIAIK